MNLRESISEKVKSVFPPNGKLLISFAVGDPPTMIAPGNILASKSSSIQISGLAGSLIQSSGYKVITSPSS